MADDNTKGVVLKGPWKRAKTVKKSQTEKISNDMAFAEDVAESVMIPMIHGLSENGVDIKSDTFVAEIGFINEIVKAIIHTQCFYLLKLLCQLKKNLLKMYTQNLIMKR